MLNVTLHHYFALRRNVRRNAKQTKNHFVGQSKHTIFFPLMSAAEVKAKTILIKVMLNYLPGRKKK